jgi:ferredoxin, 2Fe-2S
VRRHSTVRLLPHFRSEGRKSLSKIAREETERLDPIVGAGSKSRLACPAKLGAEDITAEILGFGSGSNP